MTKDTIAATINEDSYVLRGSVLRFKLQWLGRESRGSGGRALLAVEVLGDGRSAGAVVHLLLRGGAQPEELLRLLADAVTEEVLEQTMQGS